jgi:hypothetical protein
MMSESITTVQHTKDALANSVHTSLVLQEALGLKNAGVLQRMFRDPRVLEPGERSDLIASLSSAVEMLPRVPEIRVMLGMALCVELRAQEAMTHLRTAVEQDPDCYIAQLKLGELLMRLRICDQAAEHTHRAAVLADSDIQSDLARRQAATIRQMQREGIERGGYRSALAWVKNLGKRRSSQAGQPALALTE